MALQYVPVTQLTVSAKYGHADLFPFGQSITFEIIGKGSGILNVPTFMGEEFELFSGNGKHQRYTAPMNYTDSFTVQFPVDEDLLMNGDWVTGGAGKLHAHFTVILYRDDGTSWQQSYSTPGSGLNAYVGYPEDERTQVFIDSVTVEPVATQILPSNMQGLHIQSLTKAKFTVTVQKNLIAPESGFVIWDETRDLSAFNSENVASVTIDTKHSGPHPFVASVRNKLGKTGRYQGEIPHVIPYSNPQLLPYPGESAVRCFRCDEDGDPQDGGTHVHVKVQRRYSPVISEGQQLNKCAIYYQLRRSNTIFGSTVKILSEDADTDIVDIVLDLDLDTTASYVMNLIVTDTVLHSASSKFTLPTSQVDFHLENGKAAFFKYAELPNTVEINGNLKVNGTLNVTGERHEDSLVEDGTSGVWRYRKWASGISECWALVQEVNLICTSGSESSPSTGTIGTRLYPTGLFIEYPVDTAEIYIPGFTFVANGTHLPLGWHSTKYYTITGVGKSALAAAKTYKCDVYYRAIGKWK